MIAEAPKPLNTVYAQDEFCMIVPGFLLFGVFMSGREKGDADEENSNFFVRLIFCVDWSSGNGGKAKYGAEDWQRLGQSQRLRGLYSVSSGGK